MRVSNGWFEFNGFSSTSKGIKVLEPPKIVFPEQLGTAKSVAGLDGEIWLDDGSDKTIDIKIKCSAHLSALSAIGGWLRGRGRLILFNRPGLSYDARFSKAVDVEFRIPGTDPIYTFTVTFTCHPHAYIIPEAAPITITESGTMISAQGNVASRPRVKITGNGNFSVTIGLQTMFFQEVSGGVIVDTELMDAFTLDGAELYNQVVVSGFPFFRIEPYTQTVRWLVDTSETAGNVSSVEILPRWRCIG